jgi:hypothetical protein
MYFFTWSREPAHMTFPLLTAIALALEKALSAVYTLQFMNALSA